MVTQAIPGPGFLLQHLAPSPTTIAEVKDITGPSMTTDIVDVTNQSSPNQTEEVIAVLKRPGTVAFDVNFRPTDSSHNASTGLWKFWADRSLEHWQITLPDETSVLVEFYAYVTKIELHEPVVNVLTAGIEMKISGAPILGVPS